MTINPSARERVGKRVSVKTTVTSASRRFISASWEKKEESSPWTRRRGESFSPPTRTARLDPIERLRYE
jgi:hypothetical protein